MTTDTAEEGLSSSSTSTRQNPIINSSSSSQPDQPQTQQHQSSSSPTSSSSMNASPPERSNSSSSCDSKFKCNICFETPVDPVVTVCGHMYCWRCLLAWLDHGSAQCPVCKAGVTKSNVIPVYGGGIESATSTPHPASKEGQEAEKKRHDSEGRPRAERPEAPSQPSRNRGWHTASHGVQFGFFPFGVGVQFGSAGFIGNRGPPLTREQQRSQFISTALIVLGILVIFWAAFIEPLITQSF